MVLAVSPGVELVASAVVASETDINSLIIQIYCNGLRFSDASKHEHHPVPQQVQHGSPHQQPHNAGMRSANLNGPLHNEILQLTELLVFLDRQLSRFVRIPHEPNPTISESTHDTILFLFSMPSPHLLIAMPMHHEFVLLVSHVSAKSKDGGFASQKKDETDLHRTKSAESMNRRSSTFLVADLSDSFSAVEAALSSWGSVCKSGGGAGVAIAWKFAVTTGSSLTENNGSVDGVIVLICIRGRVSSGIAVFDAFGFNCPHSLIKSECDLGKMFHFHCNVSNSHASSLFLCSCFESIANIGSQSRTPASQCSFAIVDISCSIRKNCPCSSMCTLVHTKIPN
jgi:hypothetical protein